ncbi:MAG: hypothetical protein ACT4OY_05945 [Alphaproteobacteria bacterium]
MSLSIKYNYRPSFQPGFEYYGDFGAIGESSNFDDEDHQVGPVAYGSFGDHAGYEAGYLFGLSDAAPDGEAKLILKYLIDF